MPRIAEITDDDLTVDLIDNSNIAAKAGDGFGSTRFDPAAYDAKVPGEDALLFVENWELVARGTDQDGLTDNVRDLIRLLRRAFLYRTDQGYRESHQPVYITMQVTGETNARHAMVWGCRALEHPDLFGTETTYSSLIREFGVNIARYIWRDGVPGTLPPILVLDPTDGPNYSTDELDYEVDLLDHKGAAPSTKTGGILGRPGKFGRGFQAAEAVTNLVTNPSFETNVTGWTNGGSGVITRVSSQARYGAYSVEDVTGVNAFAGLYQEADIAINIDTEYAVSLWIKGTVGVGTPMKLVAQGDVTNPLGTTTFNLPSEWTKIVLIITTSGTETIIDKFFVQKNNDATDITFYVDGAQLEEKAYPTPYCDGSLGLGHAWTGGAHASTSTRVKTTLNYVTPVGGTAFTVSCLYDPTALADEMSAMSLFNWQGDGSNEVAIRLDAPNDNFYAYVEIDGTAVVCDEAAGETDRLVPILYTITWDGSTVILYKNGVAEADTEALAGPWESTKEPDAIHIGSSAGASNTANGVIDDLFILDRAMSAAEVLAYYNSGKAFAGDPDLLFYQNFDGPQRVHVTNFRDDIELTNIKVEDTDAGPGYTDVEGTVEWVMFPDPIGTNDQLLFGSTDHFPKTIVIPRLSVAGDLTDSDFKVYYWDGGGYTELVLGTDYTCFPGPTLEDCFEQNDHDIVISINPPNNADQVAIDGDTCDWVIIQEAHAAPVYAVHPVSSYEPYTQRTPTIKVPTTALLGDVPPYLLARLHTPAGGDENENFASTSRIIVGSKEDPGVFVSRLNLGGDDNPTGWAASDDTDTTFTPQPVSPGGTNAVCTFGGDETMVKRVTLTGTGKLGAWFGEYRVFVLAEQKSGAAGETAIMLRTYIHETATYSPKHDTNGGAGVVSLGTDQKREVFDLGKIKIPFTRGANADDLTNADIIFEIHAERTAGAGTLEFSELVLMPVGKYSCELDDPILDSVNGTSALRGASVLQVDGGVLLLRTGKFIRSEPYLYPAEEWGRGGPPLKVEPETDVTLYFLIMHFPDGGTWGDPPFIASPACSFMFELYSHACFEILRGNN